MKFKILTIFLLTLLHAFCAIAIENEDLTELEIRIENLERRVLAKSSDSNQALYNRIETLEETIKSINSKLEELSKQINNYSSSMHNLQNQVNDKLRSNSSQNHVTPNAGQNDDLIAKFAEEASSLDNQPKQPLKPVTPGDAKSEFEHAFTMLKNSEYDEAEKEFSSFVAKYPKDELSGQAYYWLGEAFYNKKVYNKAALNYLYSIKYFPDGSKAEQSTYKLAVSFARLGKKQEACSSFSNFLIKFKKAPTQLINSSKDEMKKLGCKTVS